MDFQLFLIEHLATPKAGLTSLRANGTPQPLGAPTNLSFALGVIGQCLCRVRLSKEPNPALTMPTLPKRPAFARESPEISQGIDSTQALCSSFLNHPAIALISSYNLFYTFASQGLMQRLDSLNLQKFSFWPGRKALSGGRVFCTHPIDAGSQSLWWAEKNSAHLPGS